MNYPRIYLVQKKLGEFVKKTRLDLGLSLDEVSVNSKKGGGQGISPSYVGKIENEEVNPTTPYLKALAKGLGISEQLIIDIARGESSDTPVYKQFAEMFEKLPKNRQDDLMMFAKLFFEESNEPVFRPNYKDDEPVFYPEYKDEKIKKKKVS